MAFPLEDSEKERLVPCPVCGETKDLWIKQGFGAAVGCVKCHIIADWTPGNDFEEERRDGMDHWNKEMSLPEAREKSLREIAEGKARRGEK
jgi:hypothetical protein